MGVEYFRAMIYADELHRLDSERDARRHDEAAGPADEEEDEATVQLREHCQKQLGELAAKFQKYEILAPVNFAHQNQLIQAEIASLQGDVTLAMHHYQESIRLARKNSFTVGEAQAYEHSANFYLKHRILSVGIPLLHAAADRYSTWGSVRKSTMIFERITQLEGSLEFSHLYGAATAADDEIGQMMVSSAVDVGGSMLPSMQDELLEHLPGKLSGARPRTSSTSGPMSPSLAPDVKFADLFTRSLPGGLAARQYHGSNLGITTNELANFATDLNALVCTIEKGPAEFDTTLLQAACKHCSASYGALVRIHDSKIVGTTRCKYLELAGHKPEPPPTLTNPDGDESDKDVGLCERIVFYAHRTRKYVLVPDPLRDMRTAEDPYVKRSQPKSILCLPIMFRDECLGVIYLENRMLGTAFSTKNVNLGRWLSVIAAHTWCYLDKTEGLVRENMVLRRTMDRFEKMADASPQVIINTHKGMCNAPGRSPVQRGWVETDSRAGCMW